jgi:hypothetical protein
LSAAKEQQDACGITASVAYLSYEYRRKARREISNLSSRVSAGDPGAWLLSLVTATSMC